MRERLRLVLVCAGISFGSPLACASHGVDVMQDEQPSDRGTETGENQLNNCEVYEWTHECIACIKTQCCEGHLLCRGDETCSCTYDCVIDGGDGLSCARACDAEFDTPGITEMFTCLSEACSSASCQVEE